jgi:hypothetical protein
MELRKTLPEKPEIVISFMGQTYVISSDRMQIIDLLLSTIKCY